MTTSRDDTVAFEDNSGLEGFASETPVFTEMLKEKGRDAQGRVLFLLGSYFRARTFHFMYSFCRHQYLRGKTYPRLLIQPFNATSFLMIPWVIFNIFDSISIRLTYNGFCEKCQMKFRKYTANQEHDRKECLYNLEHSSLIDDIISGKILQTEDQHMQQSQTVIAAGRKSAYYDLCFGKDFFSSMLDITCIWFSVGLIILILVWLFFPVLFVGVHKLGI